MSPAFSISDLPLSLTPCHLSILLHCSVSILLTLTFTCQPNFLSVGQIGYPNLSTEYNKFLNIYFQFCLDNTSSFGNLFAQIFEPPPHTPLSLPWDSANVGRAIISRQIGAGIFCVLDSNI